MYDHVLLPVEISGVDDYRRAHEVAAGLLNSGGKITCLHAIEPIPSYVATHVPPDFEVQSREAAQTQLKEHSAEFSGVETALVVGSAGRSIVDWAEKEGVDCIVIQSHRPAFTDLFLGSTAAWVVRHANMSVHVVR